MFTFAALLLQTRMERFLQTSQVIEAQGGTEGRYRGGCSIGLGCRYHFEGQYGICKTELKAKTYVA